MKTLLLIAALATGAFADYLFHPVVLDAIRYAECDIIDGKCHPYTIRLNGKKTLKAARLAGYNPHGCVLRFGSAKEAEAAVVDLIDHGIENIDLGPYQINYRYHPAPVTVYFDERLARAFATLILKELTDKYGYSWQTLGRYHSATTRLNRSYYLKLHNYIYKGK